MCVWVLWNDLFHSQGPLKGTKMVTSTFYNFPLFSFIFLYPFYSFSRTARQPIQKLACIRRWNTSKISFFWKTKKAFFFLLFLPIFRNSIAPHAYKPTPTTTLCTYNNVNNSAHNESMNSFNQKIFASATKTKRKCGKFMCRQKSCQKFTLHWFHKRKIKLYIFFAEANLYQQHSNWKRKLFTHSALRCRWFSLPLARYTLIQRTNFSHKNCFFSLRYSVFYFLNPFVRTFCYHSIFVLGYKNNKHINKGSRKKSPN